MLAGYHNHNWGWSVVGVRGSHYVVLHCLINESNGRGRIEKCKIGTIARASNIAPETARGILRKLETWELIKRDSRRKPNGQKASNGYLLNRSRYWPKEDAGEKLGLDLWLFFLKRLTQLRGAEQTVVLQSQIRSAFFDASQRADRKRHKKSGALYLLAETDVVNAAFEDNLHWLLKLRKEIPHFRIDFIELVNRVRIPKE